MWKIERIGMRNEEKENPRNSINDFDKKISQLNEINITIPQLQDTQEQRRGIQEPLRQHARHTCLPWGNERYALPGTGDPPCCSEKWPFSPHRILEFCPYPPLMKRTTGRFWCRRRRGTSEKIKCNEVGIKINRTIRSLCSYSRWEIEKTNGSISHGLILLMVRLNVN